MSGINVRFGSKAAPEAYSSRVAAFGVKRTLKRDKSGSSEWLLSAEAVSKLHDNLTPEVAFKHSVRRY